MNKLIALAIVAAPLLAGGCTSVPGGELGETGNAQVLANAEMPAPTSSDMMASARPYLIGPFDQLSIDVFGIPELSGRTVTADAAGKISFPVAGVVNAVGLTPGQLAHLLEERLRAGHVRDPQVSVNLKEAVSQTVTIDGQVTQPGVYPVLGGMTLMKAVATARGVSEYAKLDDVVVLRTVGDQRYAALYNLAAIRRGNYSDPEIYPNDAVIVGESRARRIFKDFLQVVPLLTAPLIVALQSGTGN
jgi:polysaccharide biosynthesis/export protein